MEIEEAKTLIEKEKSDRVKAAIEKYNKCIEEMRTELNVTVTVAGAFEGSVCKIQLLFKAG